MRTDRPVLTDYEYIGHLMEKLFFDNVNRDLHTRVPNAISVMRASSLADVRGVDGVVQIKYLYGIRRVPLQIKHGGNMDRQEFMPTHFGFRVPVLRLYASISLNQMHHRLAQLLAHPDVANYDYDRKLSLLEHDASTCGERDLIVHIQLVRKELAYSRKGAPCIPDFA